MTEGKTQTLCRHNKRFNGISQASAESQGQTSRVACKQVTNQCPDSENEEEKPKSVGYYNQTKLWVNPACLEHMLREGIWPRCTHFLSQLFCL